MTNDEFASFSVRLEQAKLALESLERESVRP